jgi:hypothetical protein
VTSRTFADVTATWRDDGLLAHLADRDGSWLAYFRVEPWHGDQELTADLAWVVSWLDPSQDTPTMLRAAFERPAMTADTPERQRELIEAALDAMTEPPVTPLPFAAPAPTPRDADEWAEHLDLQINCWEETFRELSDACAATGVAADYLRYRTLTQALDWAYAVDSSLTALWRMLPDHQREQASAETDERARKAAEHNASGQLPFDVETDLAFAGYVRRLKDHQPYEHWGELLLAGVFQGSFFEAVAWVRGRSSTPRHPHRSTYVSTRPEWSHAGNGGRVTCSREAGRMMSDGAFTTGSSLDATCSGSLATSPRSSPTPSANWFVASA